MRLFVGTLIVLLVVALSTDVQAVPTFAWVEPWNVTLLPFGGGQSAFGASATQDGQILNTAADTAVAKSEAAVAFPIVTSEGLTFSRQFLLSGAAQGWAVSLNGVLNGSLLFGGSVSAMASVTPSLSIAFQQAAPFLTVPSVEVNQLLSQTAILTDGLYTVTGSLTTVAPAARGPAFSDFFGTGPNDPRGFQVSVTASPVPEPSTLLLLASGLPGAAWAYRKRLAILNLAKF